MKEKTITIREFLRNYKKFATQKNTIVITKNGKPQNIFIPYEEWQKKRKKEGVPITTLLDIAKKYMIKGGPKDLSQRIDEIVYGAPNPYRNDNP